MLRSSLFSFAAASLMTSMIASAAIASSSDYDTGGGVPPVAGTGTSRTQTNDSSWAKLSKNLSYGFFNFSAAPIEATNNFAAQVRAYNYFAIDYRLGKGRKWSLRPTFEFTTNGLDDRNQFRESNARIADAFLVYVDNDFALLPYDIEVDAQMRFYAPTSKSSQERGMITRLRPDIKIRRKFTRAVELLWQVEPDYYVQSLRAYTDERGAVKLNNHYGYETKLELSYKFNYTVGTSFAVGHSQSWTHVSPENRKDNPFIKSEMTLGPSVNISAGPVFLVAGISQSHDVYMPKRDFSMFHPEDTEYYLLNNWRF